MRKKFLSILLAVGMVFSASPIATYAADTANGISAAESKEAIKDSMSGLVSETDGWQVEESSLPELEAEDSFETLVGSDNSVSIDSMDEFAPVYRDFLVRRVNYFYISLPMETTEESVKDYKPVSIAVNDDEPNSWSTGSNIAYCSFSGDPNCSSPGDEMQSITFKMYATHTYGYTGDNQEYFFVGLQNAVPQDVSVLATATIDSGSNEGLICADEVEAVFNEDRTAVRFHASCPLGVTNQTFVAIRLDFVGLQLTNDKEEKITELSHAVSDIYWDEALDYDGKPYEGDYLREQMIPNFAVGTDLVAKEGNHVTYDAILSFSISYETTTDQEAEVDQEVEAALVELDLEGKPDYVKVKEIHDYIIRNTEYDMNERYCHTAYGGFVLHRAVCDGMSLMFYRLCREVGLDVRVVSGDGQIDQETDEWGGHAWNIVKLGDLWYYVDVTFDNAPSYTDDGVEWAISYWYFLRGTMSWEDRSERNGHILGQEYLTEEFIASHPISGDDYVYEEEPLIEEPSFEKASLNLGGKIGVNLFMNLPASDDGYEGSYVEFTVNGVKSKSYYDKYNKNKDGSLFRFTCYVNSIQMADDIAAVFHYMRDGSEMTVSRDFTIEGYIDQLVNSGESDEAKDLAKALNNFGYYTQRYLSVENGFSLDGENPDHKPMSGLFNGEYNNADAADVVEAIGKVRPVVYKSKDVSDLGMSLVLDSGTDMTVTFNVASDYSGEVGATIAGSPAEVTRTKNGKYKVVVKNISAHLLAKPYDITITTADHTDISISALDYAGLSLQNPRSSEQTNALIALYKYYQAAAAYIDSLSN